MKRVQLIGSEPATVNFSDPALPPRMTVEKIHAGYDCVVTGAGVRLPPNWLVLFDAAVNAIHRAAPQAAIAFNTRPDDSGAAARAGSDITYGPVISTYRTRL